MDELSVPADIDPLTPDVMVSDLETLAIKADSDGLTDAELTYQVALRQTITDALNTTPQDD